MSQHRLHHFQKKLGSFRGEDATERLRGLLRELQSDGHTMNQWVIVADNALCHSELEQVCLEEEFSRVSIVRLAPYSATMNLYNLIFLNTLSSIKAKIKSSLSMNSNAEDRGGP